MNVYFKISKTLKNILDQDYSKHNGSVVYCEENKKVYLIMNDQLVAISPGKEEIERRKVRRVNCCNCGGLLPKQEVYSAIVQCPYCGSVQDVEDLEEVKIS